ncbi:MAG: NUDIX hydrolase [Bryobacterales bacterium]|nr:NUDIX hydrolase [Bryobacterales bacterium]
MTRVRRKYPVRPVVGVGAIILRRGRVLLVLRRRPPAAGLWSLPGGVLEAGERLEDGVRREVLEETGLKVAPLRVFEVFERILRQEDGRLEYHYVLIDYLCRVTGGELRPSDDAGAAEWVRRDDLRRRQITEGTREVILRAFRSARR